MSHYLKPLPTVTSLNRPFWEATKRHELALQYCKDCGGVVWPISPICHECWSRSLEWRAVSGRGRLSSWIVYHRAFHPGFKDDVPYNVIEVELEEGVRLVSNLVGTELNAFRDGMPVEAYFDDVTPTITLVKFRERNAI